MTDENPPVQKDVNPLLARVHLPGQTYRLPSGGLFYTKGELSREVENGEVYVQPMSAYDEILLKTPDLLLNGSAIEKVFNRCIPQILKPLEMFSRDVDFLMVCLRVITYGDEMRVTYTHDCEDATEHKYTIDLNKFIVNSKSIDPTKVKTIYSVTIDNGQTVKMHPARIKDVLTMMQQYDPNKKMTAEEEHDAALETIMGVVTDVDGITDPNHIKEWIAKISAKWAGQISAAIEETGDFGPDLTHKMKCKDCEGEITITAPINPLSFFF